MMASVDLFAEEDSDLDIIEENERNEGPNSGEDNDSDTAENGRNEEARSENDDNEANEDAPQEAEDASKTVVKPKRVIRGQRPKLNEDTLRGKRGITTLESHFERIKYKGHGYEEEDLSAILKTYEYWCHRLFPQYPFESCVSKIEQLGQKKKVIKTFVKKIRLNMLNDDEPTDLVPDNDGFGAEDNLTLGAPDDNLDAEENFDQFDELIGSIDNQPALPSNSAPIEMTEAIQERIRLNREKAEKLRQEKLKKAESSSHNETRQTSQTEHHSDEEVDIDSIFDTIQNSNGQESEIASTSTKDVTPQIEFSEEMMEED